MWHGKEGNIPASPNAFVVPVNLVNQVQAEIHKYLQKGTFDVFPYLGKHATRLAWWEDIWTRSKHDDSRKILLSTPNVSHNSRSLTQVYLPGYSCKATSSDYDSAFPQVTRNAPTTIPAKRRKNAPKNTIFDQHWRCMLVDEANNCRNIGKVYSSMIKLRSVSDFMVAMTATPVTTRLMVSY
jgi:hypothetical protein